MRVSTTLLESYRRFVATEWGDEAELVASIRGEPFEPRWQMQAGSAWALAMEGVPREEEMMIEEARESGKPCFYHRWGAFWFSSSAVAASLAHIGHGLCEVKTVRPYATPEGMVNVVAKCDHIQGTVIQENKAKFSSIDVRDYDDSLQWRFYLHAFNAACVRYNLFDFKEPDGGGYCELRGIQTVTYWPYAELAEDCREWVFGFVEWCRVRGLLGYLNREGSSVTAEAV